MTTDKKARLLEIARRLDELGDDFPEFEKFSEDLGAIADAWPQPQNDARSFPPKSRIVAEIEHLLEREIQERLMGPDARRYRYEMERDMYMHPQRPEPLDLLRRDLASAQKQQVLKDLGT